MDGPANADGYKPDPLPLYGHSPRKVGKEVADLRARTRNAGSVKLESGEILDHVQGTQDYPKLNRPEYPQPAFLRYRCGLKGEWETQVHFGGAPRDVPNEQAENYTTPIPLPLAMTAKAGEEDVVLARLFSDDGSPNFAAIRAAFPPPAPKEPG